MRLGKKNPMRVGNSGSGIMRNTPTGTYSNPSGGDDWTGFGVHSVEGANT